MFYIEFIQLILPLDGILTIKKNVFTINTLSCFRQEQVDQDAEFACKMQRFYDNEGDGVTATLPSIAPVGAEVLRWVLERSGCCLSTLLCLIPAICNLICGGNGVFMRLLLVLDTQPMCGIPVPYDDGVILSPAAEELLLSNLPRCCPWLKQLP